METGTPPKVAILGAQLRKRTQFPSIGKFIRRLSLCNTYEGVGMALKHAKTVEAAREAVEPYMKRLRATEEWSGANDASGQGPFEADGKHAKHGAALAACALNLQASESDQ